MSEKYDWKDLGLKMGLEIHQQLNTKSKLFCSCPTELVDDDVDLIRWKAVPHGTH